MTQIHVPKEMTVQRSTDNRPPVSFWFRMVAGLSLSAVVLSLITHQWHFLLATLPLIVLSIMFGIIRYVNDGGCE
jgi:hypothetical protein